MSSHPSEKPASAAAMDALDLDDLFLEGDDGPSLFADMEIDLDNMGGIFDAPAAAAGPAAASTYDNQRGGGGGRDNVLIGRQSSSASSTRGKRVRTAKTNPHLLAAEQQQEGNESAQKRQSAIQKELQRLQDSNDVPMFGEPINSKRKRRRSKKIQEGDEESQKKEAETSSSAAAAANTGKVASKKKRRSSKVTTQQMDLQSAAQTQQQPQLHQQQQALQQIFHQMNPQQQEMLQKKAEAMGLNIFASSSSSSSNSPALQAQSLSNLLLYQQENINDCGLQPSTSFYPFCALPSELDIKRGQKVFPVLEKINATSVRHINTDPEQQALHNSSNTRIDATSPLYTLFRQHLGLIQNENSHRGIYDLIEATKLANGFMMNEDGKKRMAQELSRLLAQCLKQTAFIKQNLSNLESFVKGGEGRWSNADIQSLFPDPKPKVGTSIAPSFSGWGINTDKTSSASKRGSLSTPGGPIISVKVKVRVPGWRDKSGARLVAKLSCPPGWKAAMKRENLKAEAKKAASENVVTPSSTSTTTTTKSTASRKRTTKESSSSAPTPPVTNKITTEEPKIAVPFVSAYQNDQQQQRETTTQIPNQEHQDSSILHNLYTKILRPSISPSLRRELLASEISSTVSRLESARLTGQWAKARKLQEQMKALQSVYKDDIDIVPDMCNTIGMWRWMEHTNYFKDIEGEEEVYQELEDCVHDSNEEKMFESKSSILEEGTLWGSSGMLEKRRVSTTTMDGSEGNEENTDRMNDDIESSPLFDRLQSLLVEVDGSDDDDDDIIASLPHFSADQFINGPAGGNDESDNGMIDVSALTLDQRTYIQLCAVRLIDATIPPSCVLKRAIPTVSTSDKEEDGESIDLILNKMKMRLSDLQSNNVEVTALQRKALLHVKQAPERKQRERDEDAVLAKYKQMQKMQNEEKDEKKRSSSRTRASSG